MRVVDRVRLGLAGTWILVAGVALVAGCGSTIDGRPVAGPGAGPTEPTFPTSRPTVSPPTSTPTAPPSAPPTSTAPPGTIELPADPDGYVFIVTKSGKTRCQISTATVGCEAQFTDSPMRDDEHANGVRVTADGALDWVLGNMGDIPVVPIDYRRYQAQGWAIDATIEGTRFTNNDTGHGMFVSIDRVDAF